MLDLLRKKINSIDLKILKLISDRMSLSQKIKREKENAGLDIHDNQREKKVIANWQKNAFAQKLDSVFVKKLIKLIIRESKRIQRDRF